MTTTIQELAEIKLDIALKNALERRNYEFYPTDKHNYSYNDDVRLFKISHISYERERKNTDLNLIDFSQILSSISTGAKKIAYVIEGSKDGISLYLGTIDEEYEFLKDSFCGIYGGSRLEDKKPNNINYEYKKAMLGIPSLKRDSDKEYKQNLEKIIKPLYGKNFKITIFANSYDLYEIQEMISKYYELGSEIHTLVKQSKGFNSSETENKNTSKSITITKGEAITHTHTKPTEEDRKRAKQVGLVQGIIATIGAVGGAIAGGTIGGPNGAFAGASIGVQTGSSLGGGITQGFLKNETISDSKSYNKSKSSSESISEGFSKTKGISLNLEQLNKSAEALEKLTDEYVQRHQKGLSTGMWNVSVYIESDIKATISSLENSLRSVYSGDDSFYEPIRFSNDLKDIEVSRFPIINFKEINHPIHNSLMGLSTALHTEELAILCAMPNNDINGISVSKVSSFGLTQANMDDDFISIGEVLDKKLPINQRFKLSKNAINSHIFVSGITGSGKSNTIRNILLKLNKENIPFLVIEPAKSEYKCLASEIKDLQIFRPGAKGDIFKFNPFVFDYSKDNKSTTLTKHVDMLKTTFSSAFPMYGPMAYVLEDAIYRAYEDKGWDFTSEENPYYVEAKSANTFKKSELFPNMNDLLAKVEEVIEESDYAGEVHSNIKAALKTRIKNLTLGVKGKIFNSRWAIDSKILFTKPTIIELSNIVNDEEKSLLMGLLLNKLYEYKEEQGQDSKLNQVCVVEEAHRLLPNVSFNSSEEQSNTKAKAVETFVNMLAEIRAYGVGMIIADQVASKLHPDVIKNTNIKIIQRTMAYDDRELVGKAINLNEEQILDIAELKTGEAIVHNKDIHQAFMVKIDKAKDLVFDDSQVSKFYERFLDEYEDYKYELYLEKMYYLDINIRNQYLLNIDKKRLKIDTLNLIKSMAINKNIESSWKNFISNISEDKRIRLETKDIYIYLFLMGLNELKFISNKAYYKSLDRYLEVIKNLIVNIKNIIECKNIDKLRLISSDYVINLGNDDLFEEYDRNYSLIMIELMLNDEELKDKVNEIMSSDGDLIIRIDKAVKTIFNANSLELRKSFVAFRYGKDFIDIEFLER